MCIMDKQAALEETLVGDRMGCRKATSHLEALHRPRRPCECLKPAVAVIVVMGLLVVALVAGFIACYFFITPSTITNNNQVRNIFYSDRNFSHKLTCFVGLNIYFMPFC